LRFWKPKFALQRNKKKLADLWMGGLALYSAKCPPLPIWASTCYLELTLCGLHTHEACLPPLWYLTRGKDMLTITASTTPPKSIYPNGSSSCCCLRCEKWLNISSTLWTACASTLLLFPDFSSQSSCTCPSCSNICQSCSGARRSCCSLSNVVEHIHRVMVLVHLVSAFISGVVVLVLPVVILESIWQQKTSRVSHTRSGLVWTLLITQPFHWPPSTSAADRILLYRRESILAVSRLPQSQK
jgi:hypothetical protein